MKWAAVILAAGQGTRMKSRLPKVLHPVAGRPMIAYPVEAVRAIGIDKPVLVIGYEGEAVRKFLGDGAHYVRQAELFGTGDAVKRARPAVENEADAVLVLYGDMPLLKPETLQSLVEKHESTRPCMTILTAFSKDSMGFGRIVRDADFRPLLIVEEAEASPEELAINELNCGIYCFDANWLWKNIEKLKPSPKKGEYYLTDLLGFAAAQNSLIESETLADLEQVIGINTRAHLALAERVMRDHIRDRLMSNGVTLVDPASTFIDATVEIGQDTTILPGTQIDGKTRIGRDCRIGPNAQLHDSLVGDRCVILSSMLENCILGDDVRIGPYCHLRSGTELARRVHLGDHAELKNAKLGEDTKMGHFGYVGDAEVGMRVNIGAGTVTCNFDGQRKHHTVIGDDAFIGSGTMLVAPVEVGPRARTGAGSVVTHDVPPDSLAYGVPARVVRHTD